MLTIVLIMNHRFDSLQARFKKTVLGDALGSRSVGVTTPGDIGAS